MAQSLIYFTVKTYNSTIITEVAKKDSWLYMTAEIIITIETTVRRPIEETKGIPDLTETTAKEEAAGASSVTSLTCNVKQTLIGLLFILDITGDWEYLEEPLVRF